MSQRVKMTTRIEGMCYVLSSEPIACPLCGVVTELMTPHTCVKEVSHAVKPAAVRRKAIGREARSER